MPKVHDPEGGRGYGRRIDGPDGWPVFGLLTCADPLPQYRTHREAYRACQAALKVLRENTRKLKAKGHLEPRLMEWQCAIEACARSIDHPELNPGETREAYGRRWGQRMAALEVAMGQVGVSTPAAKNVFMAMDELRAWFKGLGQECVEPWVDRAPEARGSGGAKPKERKQRKRPRAGNAREARYMSPAGIARQYGLARDALRRRLDRFRQKSKEEDGWLEQANRKPRESLYLYDLNSDRVMRVVEAHSHSLTRAKRPAKRPAKKK